MKYKIIALVVLSIIIYSCASKSNIPTTEVKKIVPTVSVANESVTAVMTAELAEGKSLYENNCAECNSLIFRLWF